MLSKLPKLSWMQAYYGAFKLLSLRDERPWMQVQMLRGDLHSGDHLYITWYEFGPVLSLILLMIDIVSAYHKRDRALSQHFVCLGLLIVCIVQLTSIRGYGNASFLIYLLSVLCDLAAGVLILLASRRDLYPHSGGG